MLGWTPETAWTSTLPELRTAVRARIKWHNRLYGGEDDEDKQEKMKQTLRKIGK